MQRTNTMALVSLIAGIVSWVALPIAASIVAIICGHVARKQIRQSYGGETGDGLAVVGLVLGYLNLVGGIVAIIAVVFGVFGLACLGALGAAASG